MELLFQGIQSLLDLDDVPVPMSDLSDVLMKGKHPGSGRPTNKIPVEWISLWVSRSVVEDVGMPFEESKRRIPMNRFPSNECADDGPQFPRIPYSPPGNPRQPISNAGALYIPRVDGCVIGDYMKQLIDHLFELLTLFASIRLCETFLQVD